MTIFVSGRLFARTTALRTVFSRSVSSTACSAKPRPGVRSMRSATLSSTFTHWIGYFPVVVSPLSMIASACSKTAFATSVTSARVGTGFTIMLSSMCVATMTGLPSSRQRFTIRRWMIGSSSIGHSMPRSPRATMITSVASMMDAMFFTASWSSIFATMRASLPCSSSTLRSTPTSLASRQKLSATKSTPSSAPSSTSARSFSVSGGRFTFTPGRLMCRREPITPSVSTSQRRRFPIFSSAFMWMTPLSTSTTSPTEISSISPS